MGTQVLFFPPTAEKDLPRQIFLGFAHFANYAVICAAAGGVRREAMIDWKEIPKIDAHIHLMPEDVIAANQGYGDPFVDFGSLADYLQTMDEYHIEQAIVMPFNDPYMLSIDFTVESTHRNLASMVAEAPQKLLCFADVDLRKDIADTLA